MKVTSWPGAGEVGTDPGTVRPGTNDRNLGSHSVVTPIPWTRSMPRVIPASLNSQHGAGKPVHMFIDGKRYCRRKTPDYQSLSRLLRPLTSVTVKCQVNGLVVSLGRSATPVVIEASARRPDMSGKRIAFVGTGAQGAGIAADLTRAGLDVTSSNSGRPRRSHARHGLGSSCRRVDDDDGGPSTTCARLPPCARSSTSSSSSSRHTTRGGRASSSSRSLRTMGWSSACRTGCRSTTSPTSSVPSAPSARSSRWHPTCSTPASRATDPAVPIVVHRRRHPSRYHRSRAGGRRCPAPGGDRRNLTRHPVVEMDETGRERR